MSDFNLEVRYAKNNPCYKANNYIKPQGIMVHSTATPGANAERFYSLWNKSSYDRACVNAFVDDTKVLQILPWNMRSWHCGSGKLGSANNTHISFEICEPSGFKYLGNSMIGYNVKAQEPYFRKVFSNAVKLCAMLCKMYNLNPLTDIICHSEGHTRGIASNHSDVMHWFPKHNESMDSFRQAVKNEIEHKKTEDLEVVDTMNLNVNGKTIQVDRIFKDNKNYVELRSLEKAGFKVDFNVENKEVSLTNKTKELPVKVDGENTTIEAINIKGNNYCSLRGVAKVLDTFEIDYQNSEILIKSRKS